ncbi:unnamed protein product [Danaus chrysippus]|uniref:(African queen) hypothetical protein n=1 Tax=Danaus chrysippus TaxID=151541 RepID=A0A8J2VVL2_9NEOP|nr:unnamed protein product [Danaus chrysippus]
MSISRYFASRLAVDREKKRRRRRGGEAMPWEQDCRVSDNACEQLRQCQVDSAAIVPPVADIRSSRGRSDRAPDLSTSRKPQRRALLSPPE